MKKRLLTLVEDKEFQELLIMFLKSEGFDVVSTNSKDQAIAHIENITAGKQPIDLALIDLTLPEMPEIHFLQWLRQEAKLTLPAFIFIGRKDPSITDAVAKLGETELLHKPIVPEELITRVRQVLLDVEAPQVEQPKSEETREAQPCEPPQGRFVQWFKKIFGQQLRG